jgi:tRNA(fMet)-specific endonuclease VapC
MVVLDTDHMSVVEWSHTPEYQRLFQRLESSSEEAVTTIISYEEQTRGWLAFVARARTVNQQIEAYRKLNHHLDTYREIEVLEFSAKAATEFQRLRNLSVRVGTMDLKIASIVLATRAKLLSRNLKDFRQIPELDVEDWTV